MVGKVLSAGHLAANAGLFPPISPYARLQQCQSCLHAYTAAYYHSLLGYGNSETRRGTFFKTLLTPMRTRSMALSALPPVGWTRILLTNIDHSNIYGLSLRLPPPSGRFSCIRGEQEATTTCSKPCLDGVSTSSCRVGTHIFVRSGVNDSRSRLAYSATFSVSTTDQY